MENVDNKYIKCIFKGVGISLLTTVILLLIFSLILTYSNVQESTINPVIIIITTVSILIGRIIWNIKKRKNGILNSGINSKH